MSQVAEGGGSHRWYPWYVAGVLALASALSQLDRQVMGLLTEPVKADLRLTDLQMSLLQGLAFVLMHSLMALPMGYASDRWVRRTVAAAGIAFWSLATAGCGLARTFGHLFIARFGVGIGEATLWPVAQSVLPDCFAPAKLPKAFAVFQIGAYIGNGAAFAIGGLILTAFGTGLVLPIFGHLEPWQLTFMVVSLPGPLVALLMLTVREPARRDNPALASHRAKPPGFAAFLRQTRPFLDSHLGTVAASGILVFGIVAWTPSYFIRTFGWTPAQIGIAYGSVAMMAGGAGTLLSYSVARLAARNGDSAGPLRANVIALGVAAVAAILFPATASPRLALACLGLFNFCIGISSTLMPAALQIATPHAFRGRVAGLYVLASSAIGAALGPIVVAATTDILLHDPARLWLSLLIVSAFVGPTMFVLSMATYRAFGAIVSDNTDQRNGRSTAR